MNEKIQPARLRELRKRKGLTRDELGRLSKVSGRTIQRLESDREQRQSTRGHTLKHLSEALEVEEGVLTGAMLLPDAGETPGPNPERVQIGALIDSKVRNDYALIRHRYGVKASEIITAAPLLFVLLAEGSLAWRRRKLGEVEGAFEQAEKTSKTAGHMVIGVVTGKAWEYTDQERDSIVNIDLFGKHVTDEFLEAPRLEVANPFVNYLCELAGELKVPGVVKVMRDDECAFSNFPGCNICREDLDRITGKDERAQDALVYGHSRLSEIPEELMQEDDDSVTKRIEWLRDQLPDDWGQTPSIDLDEMLASAKESVQNKEGFDGSI